MTGEYCSWRVYGSTSMYIRTRTNYSILRDIFRVNKYPHPGKNYPSGRFPPNKAREHNIPENILRDILYEKTSGCQLRANARGRLFVFKRPISLFSYYLHTSWIIAMRVAIDQLMFLNMDA